jgi:hypothetical protein
LPEDNAITPIAPPRSGKESLRDLSIRPGKEANRKEPMAPPIETCEAETKLIGGYVSDNLDVWHRQAFESHLAVCPECAAFLATYKKTIALTRNFLHLARTQEAPKTLTLRLPGADRR